MERSNSLRIFNNEWNEHTEERPCNQNLTRQVYRAYRWARRIVAVCQPTCNSRINKNCVRNHSYLRSIQNDFWECKMSDVYNQTIIRKQTIKWENIQFKLKSTYSPSAVHPARVKLALISSQNSLLWLLWYAFTKRSPILFRWGAKDMKYSW